MQKATIIEVDILGSNKQNQTESPRETAEYFLNYYQEANSIITQYNWRIIKTLGDTVLISAGQDSEIENIQSLYDKLSKKYNIRLKYRTCEFIEEQINFNQYSCLDVFGKDINNLILNDEQTNRMG